MQRKSLTARLMATGIAAIVGVTTAAITGIGGAGIANAVDVATFHGQSPARLLDTRPGSPTIDGQFAGGGALGVGATLDLTILGRGGIPAAGVGAVALNVTVTNPTTAGFLTVYPSGVGRPTASNLNFRSGQTVPNMVLVPIGTAGQVAIYNGGGGTSDVIVDVLGWFPTGPAFTGLTPARLLDTRPGSPTADGQFAGLGAVGAGSTTNLPILGRGGVPPAGVGAVALNVTVTNPTAAGFLTVFPVGAVRPTASNLNFVAGRTVPNMVIVPVGMGGQVSIYNGSAGTADVIVDVLGWFPIGPAFTGLTPTRLLDTRVGSPTIDGRFAGGTAVAQSTTLNVIVAGRGGVPTSDLGAVALNITVTNPTAPGFLTIFPQGSTRPTASNLNFVAGQTVANMVIVPVGGAGQISIFNLAGASDVIVDVLGWFPNPTDPPTTSGNSLVLRVDGIGGALFGATPGASLGPISALFGPPTSDRSESFPNFDGTRYTNPATGNIFFRPFARVVCYTNGPCLTFAGTTSTALTFAGWDYFSDTDSRLIDTNGLGLNSRGSDHPGAIATIPTGGCYDTGFGRAASGIDLLLLSRGQWFLIIDSAGNIVPNMPTQSEVFVVGMFAGEAISNLEGDC